MSPQAGWINGITIIEDPNLLRFEDTLEKRTWKERLFTLPWNPFKLNKTVIISLPSEEVYFVGERGDRKIVCHPEMVEKIKKAIKERPSDFR